MDCQRCGMTVSLLLLASAVLLVGGCGGGSSQSETASTEDGVATNQLPVKHEGIKPDLTGRIQVDGSSTVYKISQLAAEEFASVAKNVEISVGYVGTGGGFKSFPDPAKKLDLCDASR